MQPKIGKLNTCEELVQHQGLSRASHEALHLHIIRRSSTPLGGV